MDELLWARRWRRVMTYLKAGALASIIAVCVSLVWLLYDARNAASVVDRKTDAVAASLDARAQHLQDKLDGTFQNANAILLQAGLAADQARLASQDQREFAKQLDQKLLALADRADMSLTQVTGDLHQTSHDLHETLVTLPPLTRSLTATVDSANALLADPNIPRTLKGLADTTDQTAATMREVTKTSANVAKMSQDVEEALYGRLHPKKRTIVLNTVWTLVKLGVSAAPLYR